MAETNNESKTGVKIKRNCGCVIETTPFYYKHYCPEHYACAQAAWERGFNHN